jgi:hypothetical protein
VRGVPSTGWNGACWERSALTALTLVLTGLALTGVLGPLLDPGFAERQPGHVHLYPGGEAVPHTHDATGAAQGGEGIVYLPPDEDAAPGLGGFGATVALAVAAVVAVALPFLRGRRPTVVVSTSALARPPVPPPPRSLLIAQSPA